MFHVSKLKSSIYLRLKTEIIFLKSIIKMLPYWVVMFSLRSRLFRFLLAGEREREPWGSRANAWGESKKKNRGEGVGRKGKVIYYTERSFVHEREAIRHNDWSVTRQNDQCQQLVNALVEVLSVFLVFLSRARRKTLNGFGNNRVNHCQGIIKSSKDGSQSNQFELTKTIKSFSGTIEENLHPTIVARLKILFQALQLS